MAIETFISEDKNRLKRRSFQSAEVIKQNATDELKALTENDFLSCFEQLQKPWRKCVAADGNYFKGDKIVDLHVVLPKDLVKLVPKTHLMSEDEWRGIGVQQSKGWIHYMTHQPEPHILLFKRPLPKEDAY